MRNLEQLQIAGLVIKHASWRPSDVVNGVKGGIKSMGDAIGGGIHKGVTAVGDGLNTAGKAIGGAARSVSDGLGGAVYRGAQAVGQGAQAAGRGIATGARAVSDGLGGAAYNASQRLGQAANTAGNFLGNQAYQGTEVLGKTLGGVRDVTQGAARIATAPITAGAAALGTLSTDSTFGEAAGAGRDQFKQTIDQGEQLQNQGRAAVREQGLGMAQGVAGIGQQMAAPIAGAGAAVGSAFGDSTMSEAGQAAQDEYRRQIQSGQNLYNQGQINSGITNPGFAKSSALAKLHALIPGW